MKNQYYQELYEWYEKGYSLAQIGKMFGTTRQSVYAGFKCRGFKLRQKVELPFQMFNGIKFTLRNTGYYGMTNGDRTSMHRFVWEFHNGKIPNNHDIHHRDRNKANNKLENLELLSKNEHARKFATGNNQYTKAKIL